MKKLIIILSAIAGLVYAISPLLKHNRKYVGVLNFNGVDLGYDVDGYLYNPDGSPFINPSGNHANVNAT